MKIFRNKEQLSTTAPPLLRTGKRTVCVDNFLEIHSLASRKGRKMSIFSGRTLDQCTSKRRKDSGKGAHDKDKQVDLKTFGSLTGNFIENSFSQPASVPRPSVN